jgi:hypothetical protein
MAYTLITKTGTMMQFYVESVAVMYQSIYGGVVFSQQILDTATMPDVINT